MLDSLTYADHLSTPHITIPIFFSSLCAGVHLVETESLDQNVPLWSHYVSLRLADGEGSLQAVHLQILGSSSPCRITAPYLPICLVAFSWLLQGGYRAAVGDIVSLRASIHKSNKSEE